MTALSAALGTIAPALVRLCEGVARGGPFPHARPQISDTLTHHAATALFFFFGMRSLYDSLLAWEGGSGEREEVEAELAGKGGKGKGKAAKGAKAKGKAVRAPLLSPVLLEVFSLTFLAEWGDKSQIATIGLAASSNPLGVTLGGCLGHLVISSCAVFIGNAMASRISERAVTVAGGALFLVFGMRSLLSGPDVHIHIPGSMVEAGAWKLTVDW